MFIQFLAKRVLKGAWESGSFVVKLNVVDCDVRVTDVSSYQFTTFLSCSICWIHMMCSSMFDNRLVSLKQCLSITSLQSFLTQWTITTHTRMNEFVEQKCIHHDKHVIVLK